MNVADTLLGTTLVTGALLVGGGSTYTHRGRKFNRDIQLARSRSHWVLRRAFLARHWPFFVLITVYTLAFGVFAAKPGL